MLPFSPANPQDSTLSTYILVSKSLKTRLCFFYTCMKESPNITIEEMSIVGPNEVGGSVKQKTKPIEAHLVSLTSPFSPLPPSPSLHTWFSLTFLPSPSSPSLPFFFRSLSHFTHPISPNIIIVDTCHTFQTGVNLIIYILSLFIHLFH